MSTATKFHALKLLIDTSDGLSAPELSEALGITRTNAYRVVSSISRDGYFKIHTKKEATYQSAPAVFKVFINEKIKPGFVPFKQSHKGYRPKDPLKKVKESFKRIGAKLESFKKA